MPPPNRKPSRRPQERRSPPSAAVSELKGASKAMYDTMTESELEDFASTGRKGLPEKKD
jgi:hypothetical protein